MFKNTYNANLPEDNSGLYALGSHFAGLAAAPVAGNVNPRAALCRVAADLGRDVSEVRSAVRFFQAVDRMAADLGPAARESILRGHRFLSPKRVMQVSRVHPERQRFALENVARGRSPFAKPPAGVDPPFDTLDYGEVRSRLARTVGSVDMVRRGLGSTAGGDLPPDAKLDLMVDHLDRLRHVCAETAALLRESGTRIVARPADVSFGADRRQGRGAGAPTRFNPALALSRVASARGIAEKNLRDLPRLLREAPPPEETAASLVDGLRILDAAAEGTAVAIQACRAGRTAASMAVGPCGVPVVEAPDGPSTSGGTYVVVFRLDGDAAITVGALGTFDFPPGIYAYVGSAFGAGGVRGRTGRHRTPIKERPRWNIDHFTPHATAIELWWTHDPIRRECSWSGVLAGTPGLGCPAPEFGARDCRKLPASGVGAAGSRCPAHFYRSEEMLDVHDFARRLARLAPGHQPVFRLRLDPDRRG